MTERDTETDLLRTHIIDAYFSPWRICDDRCGVFETFIAARDGNIQQLYIRMPLYYDQSIIIYVAPQKSNFDD